MALARSEQGFIDRIARAWERLVVALGYRLCPETGDSFATIATLVSATLRGMVIMALSNPELATQRIRANPAGASTSADWSLIGIAAASIAITFLEPDPDVDWDEKRLASLRDLLGYGAQPSDDGGTSEAPGEPHAAPQLGLMPAGSDERYNWARVWLDAIDEAEMREVVVEAWRMVVPKRVAASCTGP